MADNPTWLAVVALALIDPEGRVLLQQRPAGKRHAGCWELPGGKVENGEKPRSALVREIAEELSIALDPADLEPAHWDEETGPPDIVLFLYTCRRWQGAVQGLEGQAWGWHEPGHTDDLDLAPMDRRLMARLRRGL